MRVRLGITRHEINTNALDTGRLPGLGLLVITNTRIAAKARSSILSPVKLVKVLTNALSIHLTRSKQVPAAISIVPAVMTGV